MKIFSVISALALSSAVFAAPVPEPVNLPLGAGLPLDITKLLGPVLQLLGGAVPGGVAPSGVAGAVSSADVAKALGSATTGLTNTKTKRDGLPIDVGSLLSIVLKLAGGLNLGGPAGTVPATELSKAVGSVAGAATGPKN
ncbi:hypothetical protein GGI12_002537 [Dipsacomyces acuminosporus]|nr:hypothetical protein GGI12_002537 [Dipsacomyces acuminosporus]